MVRARKTEQQGIDHADIAEYKTGHQYTNARRQRQIATKMGKKDTMQKCAEKTTSITKQ